MNGNSQPDGWEYIETEVGGERTLVVMDKMPAGASPALAAAYQIRKQANMTGTCPSCGATYTLPNRHARRAARAQGIAISVDMLHETGCPAGDDQMQRLTAAAMN